MTSPPPNTSIDKIYAKQIQELFALANKTRAWISLKKIHTFEEILSLMAVFHNSPVFPYSNYWKTLPLDTPATPQLFGKFFDSLLANFKLEYYRWKLPEDYIPWENAIQDSLVESTPCGTITKDYTLPTPILHIDEEDAGGDLPQHPCWKYLKPHGLSNLEPSTLHKILRTHPSLSLPTHQKRGILNTLYTILGPLEAKGNLIRAGTGTGKTFIAGCIVKILYHIRFFHNKTIAPWKVLYITPPNILEQARRVFVDLFNITCPGQCYITSLDSLRSSYGKKMVRKVAKVDQGITTEVYEWYPAIHPCVFILDECQRVKNEQAAQTQLIQSISEIKTTEHVYVINLSATPFTRVSEAKSVVLNMRIPYDPYKIIRE
jgi:hypothetical protein